jgi:hypothetical protein
MFHSVGVPEVLLVAFIAVLGGFLFLLPACLVCRKAGYPVWLGVGAVLPVLNVVLLWFLGFTRWPIERELEVLRGQATAPRYCAVVRAVVSSSGGSQRGRATGELVVG